jgi:hypothetical protein
MALAEAPSGVVLARVSCSQLCKHFSLAWLVLAVLLDVGQWLTLSHQLQPKKSVELDPAKIISA